jgi:eukaryotic-like serine/threonine-protein kinase
VTEEEQLSPGWRENQALSNTDLPRPGDVLVGKYRIERVVGEGGMGVVFAARHEALDKVVAVKVLLAGAAKGDGVVERFVREAQAAARLQSEHVARVLDAGSLENDIPFIVMEYLEGCDLEELLKIGGGALPATDACDYILQALAAMAQAHAVGIIHRDLKPANLFLALRPDGTNVIKILDFGISKQTAATGREKALTGRAVLGSPAYMPPEQLRNAKSVDTRADIWSLGIVLYEMLTGAPPFDGDGVGEIFAAILEKDPPSLRTWRPELPAELDEVALKALRRKPEDRWQNVGEFAHALVPFCSARWAPLVETIDSTLARAAQLRSGGTPLESSVAVPPGAGLSLSAGGGRPALAEEPSSSVQSAKVVFTAADDVMTSSRTRDSTPPAFAERVKRRRAWMLAMLVVAGGMALFGALAVAARGYITPSVARPVIAVTTAARADIAPPPFPAPPIGAVAPIATSGDSPVESVSVPLVPIAGASDAGVRPGASAPAKAARRPTTRPAQGSASSRPKFLNSRE